MMMMMMMMMRLMDLLVCLGVLSMACGWVSSNFTVAAYAANSLFGLVAVLPQAEISSEPLKSGLNQCKNG